MDQVYQTYQLSHKIGIELIARSRAVSLAIELSEKPGSIVLDFMGVVFVSRSFADELCNISDQFKGRIEFINMDDHIKEMIDGVSEIRRRGRERGRTPAKFHKFDDVRSLSEFFMESC